MSARAEERQPYLAQLAQAWVAFRVHELRASAEAAGVSLSIADHRPDSVLLPIALQDDAAVQRLATRAVLVKSFIDVWASGESWEELEAALLSYPREKAAPYLAEGSTFRVTVSSLGKRHTDQERMEMIRRLEPLLPWKGKVRLKGSDHNFLVITETLMQAGADGTTPKGLPIEGSPTRYYFGRLVAEGRRDLVGKLDLKKRNYIGTTSLDAELSLLMANLARVQRNDLVYDPYCGTAGTLVAAAAFGARVLGCDLHLPAIRGDLRTRSGPSKLKQPKLQGISHTFRAYEMPTPVGLVHGDSGARLSCLRMPPEGIFDAIVTDPPYGIREKPAEVADERYIDRTLPAEKMDAHVPRRALAELEQILADLFALAARSLVRGGRLVFLLPTTARFTPSLLPPHPGLELEGASEQLMAARWSRWVVVMRRAAEGAASGAVGGDALAYYGDGTIAPLTNQPVERTDSEAPIFDRASLRPDDIANQAAYDAAATPAVLHPHLLGKSAGARKRLERRANAANDKEQDEKATAPDSSRSRRRRAQNAGRGVYEQQIREKLAQSGAFGDIDDLPSWKFRMGVAATLATVAMTALFVARARSGRG